MSFKLFEWWEVDQSVGAAQGHPFDYAELEMVGCITGEVVKL